MKKWNTLIKINFTVDFERTAAEIDQIVKLKINFTIDFGPTAAEIEQIVKLIVFVKRNTISSFKICINFTICSISAAVGPKSIVKLIFNFTICFISAAVGSKSAVKLIFTYRIWWFQLFFPRPHFWSSISAAVGPKQVNFIFTFTICSISERCAKNVP